MSMTAKIRRFIGDLPDLQMFASKQLLQFATRTVVDFTLWKMVEEGEIVRLARGVFVKPHKRISSIKLQEIAEFKAAVFNRQIITCAANAAQQLQLGGCGKANTYATNGNTSSFEVFGKYNTVIKLLGICPRKMRDSCVELAVRALWHIQKVNCTPKSVQLATANFKRRDRQEMASTATIWMPGWLHDFTFKLRNNAVASVQLVRESPPLLMQSVPPWTTISTPRR